jgi:hypothetical protein
MNDAGHASESSAGFGVRTLRLPWEGVESLRTILGIVDDHGLRVDQQAKHNLEAKLSAAPLQHGPVAAGNEDIEVDVDLTMPEAALLLDALRFTDLMSMELPFYDMVVDTVQFVSDQLVGLWSPQAWMAWRDDQ